jgi:hypothetical protein
MAEPILGARVAELDFRARRGGISFLNNPSVARQFPGRRPRPSSGMRLARVGKLKLVFRYFIQHPKDHPLRTQGIPLFRRVLGRLRVAEGRQGLCLAGPRGHQVAVLDVAEAADLLGDARQIHRRRVVLAIE